MLLYKAYIWESGKQLINMTYLTIFMTSVDLTMLSFLGAEEESVKGSIILL